jgi:predicted transcriptional regulator
MKTAISVPDAVFDEAERLAKRLRISRSALYSRAMREYLARHAPDRVTDALDDLADEMDTGADPFVTAAGRTILERDEW